MPLRGPGTRRRIDSSRGVDRPRGGSGIDPSRQLIARIDVLELAASADWFLQLIAPEVIEAAVLGRYVRDLIATGRWQQIAIVPRPDDGGAGSRLDVYGVPSRPEQTI
jgi:hypothetical protein